MREKILYCKKIFLFFMMKVQSLDARWHSILVHFDKLQSDKKFLGFKSLLNFYSNLFNYKSSRNRIFLLQKCSVKCQVVHADNREACLAFSRQIGGSEHFNFVPTTTTPRNFFFSSPSFAFRTQENQNFMKM